MNDGGKELCSEHRNSSAPNNYKKGKKKKDCFKSQSLLRTLKVFPGDHNY